MDSVEAEEEQEVEQEMAKFWEEEVDRIVAEDVAWV